MKKKFITLLLGSLLVLNLGCTEDTTEKSIPETSEKKATNILYEENGLKIENVDGWKKVKEAKEEDSWSVEFQHSSGEGKFILSEVSNDLSQYEIISEFQKNRPQMFGIDRFEGGFFFGIEHGFRVSEEFPYTENPNDEITVNGAVVSGTPKELERFQHMEIVRASVLGVTIDKY